MQNQLQNVLLQLQGQYKEEYWNLSCINFLGYKFIKLNVNMSQLIEIYINLVNLLIFYTIAFLFLGYFKNFLIFLL